MEFSSIVPNMITPKTTFLAPNGWRYRQARDLAEKAARRRIRRWGRSPESVGERPHLSGSIMQEGHGRSMSGWSSRDRRAAWSPCPFPYEPPYGSCLVVGDRMLARAALYYTERNSTEPLVVEPRWASRWPRTATFSLARLACHSFALFHREPNDNCLDI